MSGAFRRTACRSFLAYEATHHMGSLSTPPQAAKLANPGIEADVAKDLQSGSLSYSADLSILEDAAAGGMTASKFSTLQTFASELNTTGGISVSPYVQEITDDVIFGNSANVTWNGGAANATALGNLTAAIDANPS